MFLAVVSYVGPDHSGSAFVAEMVVSSVVIGVGLVMVRRAPA
jgi:hypothetical protein